jgi:uncharacterized protein YegL
MRPVFVRATCAFACLPCVFSVLLITSCCFVLGTVSYAEIPKAANYKRIMGVTGTLETLGAFERKIMAEDFKIERMTLMPSMYGRPDSSFFKGIHIEQGLGNYHRKISQEIQATNKEGGAIIIFFESEEKLVAFQQSTYGQSISSIVTGAVTRTNSDRIDHYIKVATHTKAVTLFPRVYGRGLDFLCYDKTVQANGVYVLQTFLSADVSEEVQIKGRTCRQGAKGTYKMILLAEDLLAWAKEPVPAGAEHKHAAAAPRDPGLELTSADIARLQPLPAMDSYRELDAKRRQWFSRISAERQVQVAAANTKHTQTEQFQQCLVSPAGKRQQIEQHLAAFATTKRARGGPVTNYHVVFVLDESGSMQGTPWDQLVEALRSFVQVRIDLGATDVVSVVQFDDRAHTTLRRVTLAAAKSAQLPFKGGGTSFKPALAEAQRVIIESKATAASAALPTMVVFMSDGGNGDGVVNTETKALAASAQCGDLFQLHTIYFGSTSDSPRLQEMSQAVPNGRYHLAPTADALKQLFSEIAEDDDAVMHA